MPSSVLGPLLYLRSSKKYGIILLPCNMDRFITVHDRGGRNIIIMVIVDVVPTTKLHLAELRKVRRRFILLLHLAKRICTTSSLRF